MTTRKGESDETLDRGTLWLARGLLRPHDRGPGRGRRGHRLAQATGSSLAGLPVVRRRAGDARDPARASRLAARALECSARGHSAGPTAGCRGLGTRFKNRVASSAGGPDQLRLRAAPAGQTPPSRRCETDQENDVSGKPAAGATAAAELAVDPTPDSRVLAGRAFLVGSSLMLAWLGIGYWQTTVIRRRSRPAPQWSRGTLARIVGDGQAAPDLLVSDRLGHPVAVGLLRPEHHSRRSVRGGRAAKPARGRAGARMGPHPQPRPLVDRPVADLDADPFRASQLLVAPPPHSRRSGATGRRHSGGRAAPTTPRP